MASCLGISTESNLIKYAKVSKEHNGFNVDTFGVKFYDNEKLEETIGQIIEETQSNNIPININLENEMYNKFEVFSGLKKKDMESILSSEFELYCDDKNYNFQALTSRFILSETPLDKEKTTAIYISSDKGDILSKTQRLENYRIDGMLPLPITLPNLIETKKQNVAIVNIEDKTTVTVIANGSINNVQVIDSGMRQILESISRKENSYARAYEACKNTTIYTMDAVEGQTEGNEYLEDIMPILYDIVNQVKQVLDDNFISMQKILLTGSATIINNIELYFQEYFGTIRCEILTPSFVENRMSSINIKEYIEVNSAISLALNGLGEGNQEINFKTTTNKGGSLFEQIRNIAKMEIPIGKGKSGSAKSTGFDFSLRGELDRLEKDMVRLIVAFVLVILVFGIISFILSQMINSKIQEVDTVIADTNSVISTINEDTNKTKTKTDEYSDRIKKLEELNNQIRTEYKMKRAIPNMLNQIMAVIPREVQITSIENTTDNKIVIKAQAERYEELGYFGAVLKNNGILLDVQTSTGTRDNNLVKIDIEGNLP